MTIRITKLKVTRTRRATLELPAVYLHCPQCECEVVVIAPEQAAALLQVDTPTFEGLVAAGRVHTLTTIMGRMLVCTTSLLAD